MTRSEREQIIQRYLSGEMSSAEEGDFFVQVALDRELRHDLQAQQMIESAFRKDREAERSGHTALRTRVAAMLVASVPPQQPAPEHAPGTPAPTAAAPTAAPAPAALPPAASVPASIGSVAGQAITPLGWGALAATAATAVAVIALWNPFAAPEPAAIAPASDTGSALSRPSETPRTPELPAATPGNGAPEGGANPSAGSSTLPMTASPGPDNGPATTPGAVPERAPARNAETVAKRRVPAASTVDTEDIPESTKADGKKDDKLDVGVRVRITPKK